MMTVPELAADALGKFLANYMHRRFGSSQAHLVEMVPSIARIALECIGNSDALYHNVEHTMLVTLAGHDILRGRALHNHMPSEDYAHVIIACLTHDIGYVRGLFKGDDQDGYIVDGAGVSPHVQTAIRYLNVTSIGRQWIANLYSNVFRAERDISLSGPQK